MVLLQTMHDNTLDNAFWQFACALYQQPQVAELLLQLQDEQGFNINMVLFLLWLDTQAMFVDEKQVMHFSQLISALDNGVIQPLRQARRALKILPSLNNAYYKQAKSLELALEQELCALLYKHSLFIETIPQNDETSAARHTPSVYALASSDSQKSLLARLLGYVGKV